MDKVTVKRLKNIIWLDKNNEINNELIGGKAQNLIKIISIGISVPPGFCVTTKAWNYYLKDSDLKEKIARLLRVDNLKSKLEVIPKIREMINEKPISLSIERDIVQAYHLLSQNSEEESLVAVRSSVVGEDSLKASFAGQFDTFLSVSGEQELIKKIRECWESIFSDRVVMYSERIKFDILETRIGILVQKMVNSKKAGVLFTVHPVSGDPTQIVIEANWGLGNTVVSGLVTPDTYIVDKLNYSIIYKNIAIKNCACFIDFKGKKGNVVVEIPEYKQKKQCLSRKEILLLVEIGKKIENFFGYPQDIEWAIDKERIYILQTRPITIIGDKFDLLKNSIEL